MGEVGEQRHKVPFFHDMLMSDFGGTKRPDGLWNRDAGSFGKLEYELKVIGLFLWRNRAAAAERLEACGGEFEGACGRRDDDRR